MRKLGAPRGTDGVNDRSLYNSVDMGDEQLVIQVIRENLEGLLSSELVSAVIFEALEVYAGQLPSGSGLLSFFRGSLWVAISDRLDQDIADDVVLQMTQVLGLSEQTLPSPPAIDAKNSKDANTSRCRSMNATAQIEKVKEVRIAVISDSPALERKLLLALGNRVIILPTRTAVQLRSAVDQLVPNLVLVDGTDPPLEDVTTLPPVLTHVDRLIPIAVWGATEPYAKGLRSALKRGSFDELQINFFDRKEGVGPLLDLIRSRMA